MNDNVHIAGLSLTDYTFGVANFETPDFSNSSYDGVMGLAKSVCIYPLLLYDSQGLISSILNRAFPYKTLLHLSRHLHLWGWWQAPLSLINLADLWTKMTERLRLGSSLVLHLASS